MTTTIVVPGQNVITGQPVVDALTEAAVDINALQALNVPDAGVATSTSLAGTSNHLRSVLTTESLSTAAAGSAVFVFTDSKIAVGDLVMVQWAGGTNVVGTPIISAVAAAGSATITIYNKHASVAFSGTFILNVHVLKVT